MPKTITRRAAPAGLGTAAVTAPVVAMPIIAEAAPSLVSALRAPVVETAIARMIRVDLSQADAGVKEAQEAIDWTVAEWRHLWPSTPEELVRFTNGGSWGDQDSAERDMAGDLAWRSRASLTTRLPSKSRMDSGAVCFTLHTSTETEKHLADVRRRTNRGKTPHTRAARQRAHDAYIVELETQLALAREYEATTTHILEASGIEIAKAKHKAAVAAWHSTMVDILRTPVSGARDVSAKARLILAHSKAAPRLRATSAADHRCEFSWTVGLLDDAATNGHAVMTPEASDYRRAGDFVFLMLRANDRVGIATTIEKLINLLDQLDGDPDYEPDPDREDDGDGEPVGDELDEAWSDHRSGLARRYVLAEAA